MIKGADISTLYEIEQCGGRFFDGGREQDLFDILQAYGFDYIRLRLWNDPYGPNGEPYGAGTCDYAKTLSLAKRAIAHGMGFLLDFHYSDFWADPGKQNMPKAWQGMELKQLEEVIRTYTRDTVARFHQDGAAPTMVAVGNEMSNGLLWPVGKVPNYDNISILVSAAIRGLREVDATVPVMLHLDNGGKNSLYREWFDHYMEHGEPFEVIGLSYYPFWHGTMQGLSDNMKDLALRYKKELIVAEVSMGFTMDDYAAYEGLLPEERMGYATKPALIEKIAYPMTKQGQCDFMQDFMQCLADVPNGLGKGFFYWEPGWIPVKGCGWATQAALAYTGEHGPGGNEWANQALFDYDGNSLPALTTIRQFGL